MIKKADTKKARAKRHARVRAKISGTPERPRLNVFRSAKHIYAQVIDDGGNVEGARKVGAMVAKRAVEKGIAEVVFDRGGYLYHGRVKELAEGARENGLKF